jgi:diguanylate cyclase (GGDEF)-like protein
VVLLIEGVLEVTHESPEGDVVILRTLEPGSVIGEIASLDGLARSAAVRASTRCRVLRIKSDVFRATVRERPELLEELFWQQVRRVRSLTEQVVKTHRRTIIDRLTKLYNSGFFRDRMKAELERARETGDVMGLVLVDVDDLGVYNAAHGQQEGNDALVKLADIIRSTGRRGDVIARFSGGRFAVLLYGATRDDAARFAEKVRLRVESTPFNGGTSQPLGRFTISGGVAMCPLDGVRADALIDVAEVNLARAKERGKNCVAAEPLGSDPEDENA